MQNELRALVQRHCLTLAEELDTVRQCLTRLDDPRYADAEVLEDSIAHAHRIKGSSGSLGFADISTAAALLETHLKALAALPAVSRESREEISAYLHRLSHLVETATPQNSSLYNVTIPPGPAGQTGGGA